MNYLIIILAIVLILLVYYIYTIITATPVVANNIDLTQPPVIIKSSTITNPYSSNYCIGVWVFISNYTNQINRFLTYGKSETLPLFSLRMDTTKPIMYCDLLENVIATVSSSCNTFQTVQLNTDAESFPIQKWTYITVSVSTTFIECYLNGRFVSATKVSDKSLIVLQPVVGEDKDAGPTFRFGAKGTNSDGSLILKEDQTVDCNKVNAIIRGRPDGCNVYLTGLSRWDSPLSAGDIYNNYMKGNGNNSTSSSYHMDINLKQDKNNYTLSVF